jgi:hypothetical protein
VDVVILLVFAAIFCGWLFWLAGRKPSDWKDKKDRSEG